MSTEESLIAIINHEFTLLGSGKALRSKTMAWSLCLCAPQAQVGKGDSQRATPEQIPDYRLQWFLRRTEPGYTRAPITWAGGMQVSHL